MKDIPQIKPRSILDPEPINQIKPIQEKKIEEEKGGENIGEIKMKPVIKPAIRGRKTKRIFLVGAVIFLVVVILTAVLVVFPAFSLYKKSKSLMIRGYAVRDSLNSQDINKVETELKNFKEELDSFEKSYKKFSWTNVLPFFGSYWKDGDNALNAAKYGVETAEMVLETMKPYADIIGFAGGTEQAKSGEDTANDRIEFIVQTIGEVLPKIDDISQKASLAKSSLEKIDPSRYPQKVRGVEVRPKLENAISMAEEATSFLSESKPLLEAAPYLLGIDDTRTYLVLFQNDKEIRPTGGFITAYSIMNVKNGKVEPLGSNDIYNLDSKYRPSVEAPEVLRKYIKGPYLISKNFRLRDINWSPDFKDSMELFTKEASKAGIKDIDGVIAVDTQVLVNLLDVLGEIGVPGYGNFSTKNDTRCDCPQVIYELESFADVEGPIVWSENDPTKIVYAPANYDNRKKIVGPLMNSILSNALGQEKGKLRGLFEAGWKSVTEKHVILYLLDEKAQMGAEGFNIAGRIRDYGGDYLHINDANLGGRKSNLYVTQEVNQDIEVKKDGSVEKTLTITYKNPKEQDGWLNSVLPNWTRIYVPKGSELIDSEGFEDKGETYEEFGKTVFSGGFQLRPQGVKKIVLKYKLPFKVGKDYQLLIQKQPGTDSPLYTINLGKRSEELFLKTDKELKFKI